MRKPLIVIAAALSVLAACAPATDLSVIESRLTALETRLADPVPAEADAHTAEASPFDMAVAQYILDTAGFHDMAEALAETKIVDPAYLSAVHGVRAVLASAPWPEELAEQGEAFVAKLSDLAAALEADNGEAAARLADETHEAQHDLSHAIGDWLGTASGDSH